MGVQLSRIVEFGPKSLTCAPMHVALEIWRPNQSCRRLTIRSLVAKNRQKIGELNIQTMLISNTPVVLTISSTTRW